MNPVQLILTAASLGGAIFGNKRKQIDVNWLKQHFGPAAVSEEALNLFHNILNSPYGQGLMANAAEQGQAFSRQIEQRAAATGLQGPEGSSGTGIFATSAAKGAGDALQRGVSSDFYKLALPAAQQMVQSRMDAYLQDRERGGVATDASRMWSNIGQAAGTVGAMYQPGSKKTDTTTSPQTEQISGPDNAPNLPGEDTVAVNTSSLAPQPVRYIPNVNPILQSFSKLGRFKTGRNVQPAFSGGTYAA